jgi:transposase
MHTIRPDYEQLLLLPPCVEDWVGGDHPARFLRDFVECLDLGRLGFLEPELVEGRPPYATDVLLKVWLYGYMHKLRSSRSLERACREQMGLIWLTGNHAPDHNTLWRFWTAHRSALRGVFRQVVQVAHKAGWVDLVLHAVDGTKIKASVCQKGGWRKVDLEKLLAQLDAAVDEVMSEVEQAESREGGSYRLPAELEDIERRRAKIRSALAELAAAGRKQLHPTDRDARLMKGSEGFSYQYNAQAVVDQRGGLIVASEVSSQEADNALLAPMLEQVEEHLGGAADETLADAGYYSPNQLAQAETRGTGVLVNLPDWEARAQRRGGVSSERFEYDEQKDVMVCPQGETLRFKQTRWNSHHKYRVRVYQCLRQGACLCRRGKGPRQIYRGEYHDAVARQRLKQQTPEKKALLNLRTAFAERPFALIKEHMGFRKFSVRGLDAVRTQWSLVCTAFNLRALYGRWLAGALTLP